LEEHLHGRQRRRHLLPQRQDVISQRNGKNCEGYNSVSMNHLDLHNNTATMNTLVL
jgi:hypothetical protein